MDASEHIVSIEVQAGEWSLGQISPGELVSYEFDGIGYPRSIVALGYTDGEVLASDSIQITVQDDRAVAPSDNPIVVFTSMFFGSMTSPKIGGGSWLLPQSSSCGPILNDNSV